MVQPPLCLLKTSLTNRMDSAIVLISDGLRVGDISNLPKVSKWERWDLNSGQNECKTHADDHDMIRPWLNEGGYSL